MKSIFNKNCSYLDQHLLVFFVRRSLYDVREIYVNAKLHLLLSFYLNEGNENFIEITVNRFEK